jgi:hypothetical protein
MIGISQNSERNIPPPTTMYQRLLVVDVGVGLWPKLLY